MKKTLALLLIASNAFCVGGAPPVQKGIDGGNSNAISTAFGVDTTAGNTIYIAIAQSDPAWTMLTGPSNSCLDSFTEASNSPITGAGFRIRIYTAETSGGCSSILMTSSASAAYSSWVAEYNNLNDSDLVECVASGTGTSTSLATANCVTSNPNTTLVSFGYMPADSRTFTEGSGNTIENQNGGTGHSEVAQDKNVTSAGTYTATATANSSAEWGIHVMALNNNDQTTPASTGSITMQSGTGTITTQSGTGTITIQ